MDNYSVYKHTSPSGRVYIGISCDPNKRWNKGRGYIGNIYFSRCINKYGWDNIEHEILFSNLSLDDAKKKEVELIAQYKSNEREYGYNISGGGDGLVAEESRIKMSLSRIGNNYCSGRKYTKDTKNKISQSLINYYASHAPSFLGRHHRQDTILKLKSKTVSEETKIKMSEHHADVTGSKNPSAKSVICLNFDNKIIKTYSYASLAANELNIDLSSIIKCCKGKAKSCGGYKWKYAEPGVYGWKEV